jgi:hypothetical protein
LRPSGISPEIKASTLLTARQTVQSIAMRRVPSILCLALLFVFRSVAQQPAAMNPAALNPTVKQIVDAVSEQRIAATLKKLEGFGTRYILSAQDDPAHGIGAAKRWIHDDLESYSPRLQVSYQNFSIKKGGRRGQIIRDVELSNIVAVLPGGSEKDRYVLITAHYDSVALIQKPYTGQEQIVAEGVRQAKSGAI